MPKPRRILVVTDHMPWGHRAIAKAIYGYLKPREGDLNIKVEFAQVRAELGVANDIYAFLCRYMPGTHRIAHRVGSLLASQREMFDDLARKSLPGLKKTMQWHKPDMVISCYFLLSHCLDAWRREEDKKFRLWTVVADPRTINPISFVPGADLNLVYDEVGSKLGMRWGISPERLLETGWWTREEMYRRHSRAEVISYKNKLGFTDNRPIVFVGGGSLGTNSLTRILPTLMVVKRPVGLVINTGTDRLAFNLVEEYARLFKKFRHDDVVQIRNLGWIDNMDEILASCDIAFGKAGPNFLFDVVAARKPFVAITHVGGQEDGNIDLIREKKLGWVKEKHGELSKFFLSYLQKPKVYHDKYKETIVTEAKRNEMAMGKIIENLPKEEL